MCCRLSPVGCLWAIISLIASLFNCVGYYFPYWIKGTLDGHSATLGVFRRCVYPRLNHENSVELVFECGHYTTFADIPSIYWQISTILVGVGTALSLLVAFTALSGFCLSDVITRSSARTLGCIQLLSVLLLVAGAALYPLGFNVPEVRDVCGENSGVYRLGSCQLSWSSYFLMVGTGGLVVGFLFSMCSQERKARQQVYRA